ncbi:MAG: peptide deformylase [Candidatus Saccharimonadales bacterium]
MAIKKIITLPDPRLRQKSEKIYEITPEILQLVKDMTDVALDWENSRPHEISAALSAVQIGDPKRVIIVRSDLDNKESKDFTALINPQIVKYEGNVSSDYEGCLSVSNVYGQVPRYEKVRVKAMDIDGTEVRFKVDGFLARVIQHEIDHTNGIVFIDHIRDVKDAFFKLDEKGELQPLDYEKFIEKNSILWD